MRPLTILAALFFGFVQISTAADVKLAWDAPTWTELAGYQVGYGAASGQYSTLVDVGNVTSCTISTLGPGTYYFAVRAYGIAGEQSAYSNEVVATIAGPADTTPPAISAVTSSGITASSAAISWTTNEASSSWVEYGATASYGSSTTRDTSLVTSHAQTLSGLASGTIYHYRVTSVDAAGNIAVSGDFTFTTLVPADTTPPVISAVGSSGVTGSSASISWATNEASDSQVEYGTTTSYGSSTTLNASLVASHSQSLGGLASGTTYHYRVKSKDAAGNLATSTDYTFATMDTTAPVISAVASSSITASSATISWTTNETSDSQVEYGTTTSYGNSTTLNSSLVTSHSQSLGGLASGTTYHYRVKSKDAAGNLATSTDYTFATMDTTAPVISAVASSSITASSATITWTTNEASDSQVEYGTTTSYGSSTTLNASLVTSHSQSLGGLASGTTYHYRVKSKDAAGNLATSADYTFATADTTAPVISAIASSSITASSATITWTTNEASDSQVEYGTTTSYGSSTTLNASLVTSHRQSLSGLASGTTYHFRVKSRDAAGNLAVSSDYTFATTAAVDLTTGLVAAYAFDEGTGSISSDLSGTGNTANLYSTGWVTGKYSQALSFNGSRSYVSAGIAQLPAVNQPKTISCWIYLVTKPKAMQTMLTLANATQKASVQFGYKNTQMGVLGYGDTWMLAARLPSLRMWHHMAYVFDGTQNRLYVDGVLAGTSTIAPASAAVTSFQIGRWVTGAKYFQGSIDDVRVYNRALSLDEVKLAMATPVSGASASASALAAPAAQTLTVPDAAEMALETAPQPQAGPVVEARIDKRIYRPGETVSFSSFRLSNPAGQARDVELKTWMDLPGLMPISLDLSLDDSLALAPGSVQDYGTVSLFKISGDAPSGTAGANARLLDPATGDILSEDANSFTIDAFKRTRLTAKPSAVLPQALLEVSTAGSHPKYTISNTGIEPVAVELKIWLESPEGTVIPLISVGADGSLLLDPKANIALDPLVSVQVPDDGYVIRARLLDAASGQLLSETAPN